MDGMGKQRRPRRAFTPEFKAEILEVCRRGDRSVGQVAKDFDLTATGTTSTATPPSPSAPATPGNSGAPSHRPNRTSPCDACIACVPAYHAVRLRDDNDRWLVTVRSEERLGDAVTYRITQHNGDLLAAVSLLPSLPGTRDHDLAVAAGAPRPTAPISSRRTRRCYPGTVWDEQTQQWISNADVC